MEGTAATGHNFDQFTGVLGDAIAMNPEGESTGLRVEIHEGAGACLALAEDWIRLDLGDSCESSVTLEWSQALLGSLVAPTDVVTVVALRDNGHVVAIVPTVLRRRRVAGMALRTLSLLSGLHSTHSDILRVHDRPELFDAIVGALTSLPFDWDVLRIERVLEDGSFAVQLTAALRRVGLRHRVRRGQETYSLKLPSSYPAFLETQGAKFRNHLRRKQRQLDAAGRVTILRPGLDLSVEQAYRDLLEVERRSWKHDVGTAISTVPQQEAFYRELTRAAAHRGRLHLLLMYLDGRPIAFNLGLVVGRRYSYLKTSFDESLRKLSPSTVLRARLVESLIDEGIDELDFQTEHYQWKAQWTNQARHHQSIVVFNRTPRATLYRLLLLVRDRLRPASRDEEVAGTPADT